MDIKIDLYGKQGEFFMCPDRFSAFVGGIGSGKTYAGAVKAAQFAVKPGTLGLAVAPTYPMLKDASMRSFVELADPAIEKINKSDMTVQMRGGGEVLFRSADNPNRLRGPNLHWAWIDEAAMCHPNTWEIIIGRLRADGKAGSCWITTTPKGRNWLYQRRDDMTIYRASTMDNPHLAPEFIASLQSAYSGQFARQELYGEFTMLEGLVYPMFSPDIHVQERPGADMQQWALFCDEGYTNPAVILLVGIDGDGRLHIYDEYYERGKLQAEVVHEARNWTLEYNCYVAAVDASAAGLIADMRDAGIPAQPHKGRVLDGIQAIQNRLQVQPDGRPRMTIAPHCANTINEFESYVWKDGKDEPVKEHDHAMDAIRYGEDCVGYGAAVVADPFAAW
jgi:PBSX family phage terminase large subunit